MKLFLAILLLAVPPAKGSHIPPGENMYSQCHTNVDQWDRDDPKSWRRFIDPKQLDQDVHWQKHATDHKVDCLQCHLRIEHSRDPQKMLHAAADCASCHPDHHRQGTRQPAARFDFPQRRR